MFTIDTPLTATYRMKVRAFALGVAARRTGARPEANPFDPRTVLHGPWSDGWKAGD